MSTAPPNPPSGRVVEAAKIETLRRFVKKWPTAEWMWRKNAVAAKGPMDCAEELSKALDELLPGVELPSGAAPSPMLCPKCKTPMVKQREDWFCGECDELWTGDSPRKFQPEAAAPSPEAIDLHSGSPTVTRVSEVSPSGPYSESRGATAPLPSSAQVERAVALVDRMTCEGCQNGWKLLPAGDMSQGMLGSGLARHIYTTDEDDTEYTDLCHAQGRAIIDALVREGWRTGKMSLMPTKEQQSYDRGFSDGYRMGSAPPDVTRLVEALRSLLKCPPDYGGPCHHGTRDGYEWTGRSPAIFAEARAALADHDRARGGG